MHDFTCLGIKLPLESRLTCQYGGRVELMIINNTGSHQQCYLVAMVMSNQRASLSINCSANPRGGGGVCRNTGRKRQWGWC